LFFAGMTSLVYLSVAFAQRPGDQPKPITIEQQTETLEERLERKITLDVRDMNMIDVIKFLAIKGEFNAVTSKSVEGRITLLLKSVTISDVMDIILISNNLAYHIKNDIVHVMSEDEHVAMFGKRFSDNTKVKIVHLNYAKPSYVLAALESIKSGLGKLIVDEDTGSIVLIDTPQALEEMQKSIDEMEHPLETFTYNLQYAQADIVAEKLRARLEGNKVGTIISDERSNQLIVRAIPGRREDIEKLIKELDSKTKEVLIEARVIQILFKPTFDFGVDWQMDFEDSPEEEIQKVTFKNVILNEDGLTSSDNLTKFFSKIGIGNIDTDHFEMSIRALKQVSDTKILSNPKLLVTNNQEARIHIGDTVPYIISTTSGTGDNAITSEDVRFVDVGIKLNVLPTINDDGFVTMKLRPEISTVTTKIESQGGGIPQVNKTEVETTVMVKDGNSIILGGLRSEDKSHTKRQVPWLGEIPFLGAFFTSTSDIITATEIVIFITPHIISGTKDYADIRGAIKSYQDYSPDKVIDDQRKPLNIKDPLDKNKRNNGPEKIGGNKDNERKQ